MSDNNDMLEVKNIMLSRKVMSLVCRTNFMGFTIPSGRNATGILDHSKFRLLLLFSRTN